MTRLIRMQESRKTNRSDSLALLAASALLGGCSGGGERGSVAPALPDPQSRGAELVVEYCSECHAPPQPSAHTAATWPAVAERMQHRRATKGFPPVPGPELGEIIDYLQRHARGA